MAYLGAREIIDLTSPQDSAEDELSGPMSVMKRNEKAKQSPSVYRSHVLELPGARESLSESISSQARASGAGNGRISPVRSKLLANERGITKTSREGVMPTKRKKINVTGESLDSRAKRTVQELKMSKQSQTKDAPRFVGQGKTSEMVEYVRSSPIRPSMPTQMPNGRMKTTESREPMLQKANNPTKSITKAGISRADFVKSSVSVSDDYVMLDQSAPLAAMLSKLPGTRKPERSSNSSDLRTTLKKSSPKSNQNLEKSYISPLGHVTGALDHDSDGHLTDSYSTDSSGFGKVRRRSGRKRLDSNSILQDHRIHEFRGEPDQTCISPAHVVQLASNIFGKEKTRVVAYPLYSRGSLLRNRDIGGPGHLDAQQSFMRIRQSCLDTAIQPWKEWTGASKDIISAAWASDGLSFVIGSSTDLDARNIQFNRPNNLLWCDMATGTMVELDDHKLKRSTSNTITNSETVDASRILDPYIFTTVSDICYSQDSTRFWTSSYDRTVKIWDMKNGSPSCVRTIQYPDQVDILARCDAYPVELVASAQKSTSAGVQIYQFEAGGIMRIPDPDQAEKYSLIPTAITWGSSMAATGALLAAGYGEEDNEADRHPRGDIIIWHAEAETKLTDLTARYQYVYDLAWHTYQPWLAAAMPSREKTHAGLQGTQSHIRIWEPLNMERCIYNLDCLALDINKVIFNPRDLFYVSAACTDGVVYHYDLRRPRQILAKFEHDLPISQLDPDRSRESQDFGIQFVSWNAAGTMLYSGSSDGKIKQWNPYLNNEDAFIEDIATLDAGISSGHFSPDFTNLLIGTNKGSAHVFSCAPVTPWDDDDDVQDRLYDEGEENEKSLQRSVDNKPSSFKYRAARTNSAI